MNLKEGEKWMNEKSFFLFTAFIHFQLSNNYFAKKKWEKNQFAGGCEFGDEKFLVSVRYAIVTAHWPRPIRNKQNKKLKHHNKQKKTPTKRTKCWQSKKCWHVSEWLTDSQNWIETHDLRSSDKRISFCQNKWNVNCEVGFSLV